MRLRNWMGLGRVLLIAAAVGLAAVGCGGSKDTSQSEKSGEGAVFKKTDTLKDDRDGQKYRTVKIGEQVWMAENLRFKIDDSWCYGNSEDSCAKYGRLYTWEAAKKACQSIGMRLPSRQEWEALVTVAGGTNKAGKKLKAKSGWNDYKGWNDNKGRSGNGTDDFGFSALPGGFSRAGDFNDAGNSGLWWTATEKYSDFAYHWFIDYSDFVSEESDEEASIDEGCGLSVRCVQ